MKKVQFTIISTILSFGLIVSAALLSNAIDKSNRYDNEITVKGVSERKISADRSAITISLTSKSTNVEKGQKSIEDKLIEVEKVIEELQLEQNEYKINNLQTKANFIGETNEVSSYDFLQSITIFLKDINKTDEVYFKLSKLEEEINNLTVSKPEYIITSIEKYKNEMLVVATKNSETKAIEMLKISKNNPSDLKQITQGQFEILDNKDEIIDVNQEIINQRTKKLRVVVTATYNISKIK